METVAIIETCPIFLILHRLAFLWICILTDLREYDTPTQYFYLTAHNKPRPHILYSLRKYSLPVRTAYDRCSSRRILLYRTKPCSHNIFKLIKITQVYKRFVLCKKMLARRSYNVSVINKYCFDLTRNLKIVIMNSNY